MVDMTTAERRAYRQICGADGAICTVAADQRGSMRSVLAETKEAQAAISDADLGAIKADIVRYLANGAASVLLDPKCAVPQVVDDGTLARDVALIVALDASGYDIDAEGRRMSRLVPGVGARRMRELGGTAGKILLHMRPDREGLDGFNAGIIKRCAADFAAEDALLVVEILVYRLEGEDPAAYDALRPKLIADACRLGIAAGAKVLKIQYPGSAAACAAVHEACAGVPWAVLSAGVDHKAFLGQLEVAMSHGCAGAIAGRSLWKDAISLDPDVRRDRLVNLAAPRLREIRALLAAHRAPQQG
jgi:tagatose 1,6-diphosphate aldolase